MASESLYRKWRSQSFSEMVGQDTITRTLKNALHGGTLAHAYLFAGPRGTGKTTTARLLAKTINCLNPQDSEPCNECMQCKEITSGSSFNVIEIDAASNRGIDSIRELRDKVKVPPSNGKYKVYILDEAHMLTTEAFNALLKTLEEPPPHAVFVMATTDVHKMLPTVLSRCQRFDFKRFSMRQLIGHLNFVAAQEQVKLEAGAAELIARAAAGGMRDALSLLDQAIAYSGREISLEQVQTMLGVADPRAIQKFIVAIAQLDSAGGLHLIHDLTEAGADLRQVNNQIAEFLRAMMLAKAGAQISSILDSTEEEVREIVETTRLFELEELTECARVFAQNDLIQKNQATPQLGLELALLSCIALHQRVQTGQSLQAPGTASSPPVRPQAAPPSAAALPVQSAQPTQPAPPAKPPRVVPERNEPEREKENPPPQLKAPVDFPVAATPTVAMVASEEPSDLPGWDDINLNDDEIVEPPQSTPTSQPPAPSGEPIVARAAPSLTVDQVKEKWEYVKRRVKTKKDGAKIAAILNGYTIVGVDTAGEIPVVMIKAGADFHFKTIQKEEYRSTIEWALKVELSQECGLRLLPPGSSGGTHAILPPGPVVGPTPTAPVKPAPTPQNRGGGTANPSPKAPPAPPVVRLTSVQNPVFIASVPLEPEPPTWDDLESLAETAPPLATMPTVRENSGKRALYLVKDTDNNDSPAPPKKGANRLDAARNHASSDPVVQKVVEMFKAEIKDIHLK